MDMKVVVLIGLAIILGSIICLLVSVLRDLLEKNNKIKRRHVVIDEDNLVVTRRPKPIKSNSKKAKKVISKKLKKIKQYDYDKELLQAIDEENVELEEDVKERIKQERKEELLRIAEEKRRIKEEKRLAKLEKKERIRQERIERQIAIAEEKERIRQERLEIKEEKRLAKEERKEAKRKEKEKKRIAKLKKKGKYKKAKKVVVVSEDELETYVKIKFHGSNDSFIYVAPEDVVLEKDQKIKVRIDENTVRSAKVIKGNYTRTKYKSYEYKTLDIVK